MKKQSHKPQLPVLASEIPVETKGITVKKNFPAKGRRDKKIKILPSHRAIFQHYKDQGFRSLGKAIRKTDVYSESVARRVNVITKSKSWQALMDEELPELKVAQRHSELLDKRDYKKVVTEDGKVIEVDAGPNTAAVTKGVEMAYRLRGKFTEKEAPPASSVTYNLFYKPEVRAQMKNFEEGIKQSLIHEINKKNIKEAESTEDTENSGGEADTHTA